MKAFLFCAGKGERLKLLTDKIPKCLLPVNGVPLLKRWVSKLNAWKVSDILINVSYKSDLVIDYLKDLNWNGARLSIAKELEPLGTARTLFKNKTFVKGEYGFLVVYSDVWTSFDVRKMITFFRRRPNMAVLGLHIPKTYEGKGVVTVKEGRVISFEEKPKNPKSKYVWAGIAIFHPSVLSVLNDSMVDIAKDFLPVLVKSGIVNAFYIDKDPVYDIGGSIEEYNEVNREVKKMGLRAL